MYRVLCGVFVSAILILFFAGLAHFRMDDCEQRRLAIIDAANTGRSFEQKLPLDTQIVYSPGELLKKLADPRAYERNLVARLMQRTAVVLQPGRNVRHIVIDEAVYVRNVRARDDTSGRDHVLGGADSKSPLSHSSNTRLINAPSQ